MARAELGSILLLGAGLRLPYLWGRPLWQDEALQHHLSTQGSLAQIVKAVTQQDLHPPAHSALLSLFAACPPWMMRIPSWLAGVATVWLAHRLGGALGGPRVARAAALLAAAMPAWVAYAREARPYAVSIFLLMGIYALLVEDEHRPVLNTLVAALCGAWQYMLGVLAFIPLGVACWRAPARWGWPLAACAFTASFNAAWVLPGQWARTADLPARLDPSMGLDALAFGPPALFGYPFLGATSVWSLPLGALLVCAAVARGEVDHAAYRWAWLSLAVAWALGGLGLHPFGAERPCLPLTVPIFIVMLGVYAARRLSVQLALASVIAVVACLRAPGVPIEDLPGLAPQLERHPGAIWAHASAAKALSIHAPEILIEGIVPWGCSPGDLPMETGWLVVSGSPACVAPFVEPGFEAPWSTPFTGVKVYPTPLPAQP